MQLVCGAAVVSRTFVPAPGPSSTIAAKAQESSSCATGQQLPPSVRPSVNGQLIVFDQFMAPLVAAAASRRARRSTDPEYQHRIDSDLNERRINALLMGYNEEHGETYAGMGVSVTILSLNPETWDLASISFSRDARVPELEQRAEGPPRTAVGLGDGFAARGFEGMAP